MMKTIAVLLLVFVINCFFAQENYKIYSWESAQKLGKDTVYGITFSKTKFDSIPSDLINYTNLKYLDLSKHKLTSLPYNFSNLSKLEILNLEKNDFDLFPLQICCLFSK
jgi:Leucine-rich repeat (LRR) protein